MAQSHEVLTRRQLNRAVLARQLLLERAQLDLPGALEAVCGIQAQYAPSLYVGLWSRVDGLERATVTAALAAREAIQGTLMRATIHAVSRRDYWPFALAVREARRAGWLRYHRASTATDARAAADRLRAALAGGPKRRAEAPEVGANVDWNAAGLWLDVVRVPPSGTWERRRADRYALAEDWVGPPVVEGDPVEHLVRRYLGGFGPAAAVDVASFTGLGAGELRHALDAVAPRRFRDEQGRKLYDLAEAPLPAADVPAPVRFLPTWDATLLVHARRSGVLPDEYRPRVFPARTPQTAPTFLVDGAVAGTWKYERGHVLVEPFARLTAAARRELDAEAERLAAFHT